MYTRDDQFEIGYLGRMFRDERNTMYRDLYGRPVKRSPVSFPYSYDEFVLYKANDYKNYPYHVVYSDRMFQWDSKKFDDACMAAFGDKGQFFDHRRPEDIEFFIKKYFEKPVKLKAVLQGCNVGNGYPYWVFLYEELPVLNEKNLIPL